MQYESNPANGFRDIVRKRNTDAQTHGRPDARPQGRMARYGDDNIPRPYFMGGG